MWDTPLTDSSRLDTQLTVRTRWDTQVTDRTRWDTLLTDKTRRDIGYCGAELVTGSGSSSDFLAVCTGF